MNDYSKVPAELKAFNNWVCYRLQPRGDGKMGKIPVNPLTLKDAKADDPTSWGSYAAAIRAHLQNPGKIAGIGFEFGNSPFFGVDLDHITDQGGQIKPQAQAIIDLFASYTELSPSGDGVHIICKGSYPDGWKKKARVIDGGDLEMYQTGRFFTITGQALKEYPHGLPDRSETAARLQARYNSTPGADRAPESPQRPQESTNRSDAEIIRRMLASRNGAEISALWDGDMLAYGDDHSAADLALCTHLAYWTNGDAEQMDRLFRASGLMREKWDRRESTFGTYGKRTIAKALKTFTPYTGAAQSLESVAADFDDLESPGAPASPLVETEAEKDPAAGLISAADYLRLNFSDDRERFKGYKQRKTGFENLDELTNGLYPGLYVIGALSSLGKTTFAHQMADQLAAAGDTVLFFSLEQSIFELTTKSLARESYRLFSARAPKLTAEKWTEICNRTPAPSSADACKEYEAYKEELQTRLHPLSSIEIRSGRTSGLMREAYQNYMQNAARVIVKECNFSDSVESIAAAVKAYIKNTGITPVVIVDYLQIIPAKDPRMSDKEKTDQNMRRLKILQRDLDLVLFVISSVNRANYAAPISFESFKESGGIEYTADVVWGMQYAVISGGGVFDKEKGVAEKRRKLQEEKARTPRDIELVCLKNRYGKDFSTLFRYYPKYDYFEPADSTLNDFDSTDDQTESQEPSTPAADLFNSL